MSEYMFKSLLKRIYYVLDFKKSCASMLRERLIHSLYYSEFVELTLINSPERYPLSNLQSEPFYGCVKIYGVKGIKGGARRTIGYISPEIITKNKAAVNKYKLFLQPVILQMLSIHLKPS